MPSTTIFDSAFLKTLLQGASLLALKVTGWRRSGRPPALDKFVLIAAPHTSNWDFPLTMALVFSYRMKICWMGKASLFRWPLGGLMRWLGGIPIDRSQAHQIVAQSIATFKSMSRMVMVIAPEGTRHRVAVWKTGFYRIAEGAGVPVVIGFLDYCRKVGGIGRVFHPTGDMEADLEAIRGCYRGILGKFPEKSVLTAGD